MYSISALWTAAHHRIPATFVMLNNASYRILKLNMVEYLGKAAKDREFVTQDEYLDLVRGVWSATQHR